MSIQRIKSGVIADSAVTAAKLDDSTSQLFGFRNRIINGDMQIAQRVSFPDTQPGVSLTGYYTVDRWLNVFNSAGTWTLSQSTTAPPGFGYSLKYDNTTADASLAASDEIILVQRIEGFNLQDFAYGTASAKPVTLSFWVRSNRTGTYTVEFDQFGDRQISRTYTINSANTWEYKTLTVPGDVSGSIDNDNSAEYQILFWLGAGSNLTSGTLNTSGWASVTNANRVSPSQVNMASSTVNEWFITGVQLEVGEVATPFERRPYGQELALCQRYYYLHASGSAKTIAIGGYYTSSSIDTVVFMKVSMRAAPSLVQTTGTNYYRINRNGGNDEFNSFDIIDRVTTEAAQITSTANISGTAGHVGLVITNNASSSLAFDAEL
jgi:hypothetical protein